MLLGRGSCLFHSLLLLLLLPALSLRVSADDCIRGESCGQCIQQGTHCAWCTDVESSISSRCQNRTLLEASGKCRKENIFQPATEMRISPDMLTIGQKSPRDGSEIRLEPQVIQVLVKRGDTVSINFKYKHKLNPADPEAKNVQIQTSKPPSDGYDIKFFMICHGKRVEAVRCDDVPDNQLMDMEVQVTLNECSPRLSGDAAFSYGVIGYNSVSGIYLRAVCSCECENLRFHEKRSRFCGQVGNLICGQCVCDAGRGGRECECPLSLHGVHTAKQLDDKCREKPGAPICGGAGRCRCGKCECDNATSTSDFCDCDNLSCPVGDEGGRLCSGNGVCKCGVCECERGSSRADCSCSDDTQTCVENGEVCSNHGHCECGKCICDDGFTGAFCGSDESAADTNDVDTPADAQSESTTEFAVTPQEEEVTASTEETQDATEAGSGTTEDVNDSHGLSTGVDEEDENVVEGPENMSEELHPDGSAVADAQEGGIPEEGKSSAVVAESAARVVFFSALLFQAFV